MQKKSNRRVKQKASMGMHTLTARRKAKRDDTVKSRRRVKYVRGMRLTIQSNKK